MLQRLIRELVAEEAEANAKRTIVLEDSFRSTQEEAKRLREERKREAIERSKQRQSDPNYFQKITELNTKKSDQTDDVKEVNSIDSAVSDHEVDDSKEKGISENDDPFRRSTNSSGTRRNKVFVR